MLNLCQPITKPIIFFFLLCIRNKNKIIVGWESDKFLQMNKVQTIYMLKPYYL